MKSIARKLISSLSYRVLDSEINYIKLDKTDQCRKFLFCYVVLLFWESLLTILSLRSTSCQTEQSIDCTVVREVRGK